MEYTGTRLKTEIAIDTVYTIHYFRYGKKFDVAGEAHDFWELVYLDAGEATVRAGDRTVVLRQGEAIFHPPNEFHKIRTKDKFSCSIIVSFACDSPAMAYFADRVLVPDEDERRLLRSIVRAGAEAFSDKLNLVDLKQMTRRPDAPPEDDQWIKNCLELFLLSLRKKAAGPPPAAPRLPAGGEQLADSVYSILRRELRRRPTLAEIARELGFSVSYVKQVFRSRTGLSVMTALRLLKIDEAKQMIATRRYSFTQIAYALGFSSLPHFSRVFQSVTDLSPRAYANSLRLENVL